MTGSGGVGPVRVLFLCDDNSSRSQMAEGWLRHLGDGRFIARSAGLAARHLHPLATAAMQEVGVDIGRQRGKSVDAVRSEHFDVVVTLAAEVRAVPGDLSPTFVHEHAEFDDPAWIEDADGADLDEFRRVRDALRGLVQSLLDR